MIFPLPTLKLISLTAVCLPYRLLRLLTSIIDGWTRLKEFEKCRKRDALRVDSEGL